MSFARAFVLACIVLCASIGLTSRAKLRATLASAAAPASIADPFMVGERFGPFLYDGLWRTNKQNLRLVAPNCPRPLSVWLLSSDAALDLSVFKQLVPGKNWRTRMVFEGRIQEELPYYRALALRWLTLTFSNPPYNLRDASRVFYTVFVVPDECAVSDEDILAAHSAIFIRFTGIDPNRNTASAPSH
ncbi:MAG: hypothetical protein WAK01_14685 [Methylocystis sp.]